MNSYTISEFAKEYNMYPRLYTSVEVFHGTWIQRFDAYINQISGEIDELKKKKQPTTQMREELNRLKKGQKLLNDVMMRRSLREQFVLEIEKGKKKNE